MKKTLFFSLVVCGLLFAENDNISGIKVDGKNNNVGIIQGNNNQVIKIEGNNNKVSNQEIEINKKIDNEFTNVTNSSLSQSDKSFVMALLNESKNINKEQVPLEEKNRQCKFKFEAGANLLKFGNVNLAFSYCDKIF